MRFSRNMEKINMSKTAEISDLALSLKEQGHKIVNMATGELSFKPALSIRKEACRAINKGETLYTQVAGLKELRDLIRVKLKKDKTTSTRWLLAVGQWRDSMGLNKKCSGGFR